MHVPSTVNIDTPARILASIAHILILCNEFLIESISIWGIWKIEEDSKTTQAQCMVKRNTLDNCIGGCKFFEGNVYKDIVRRKSALGNILLLPSRTITSSMVGLFKRIPWLFILISQNGMNTHISTMSLSIFYIGNVSAYYWITRTTMAELLL